MVENLRKNQFLIDDFLLFNVFSGATSQHVVLLTRNERPVSLRLELMGGRTNVIDNHFDIATRQATIGTPHSLFIMVLSCIA
jgi:hypothetical protein